jgi:hypothetical protein
MPPALTLSAADALRGHFEREILFRSYDGDLISVN